MREFFKNLLKTSDSIKQEKNDLNIKYIGPSELNGVTAELATVKQGRPDQAQTQAQAQAQIDARSAIEARIMSSPQPQETPSSHYQRIESAQISTGSTDVNQGQEEQGGLGGQGRLGGQGGHGGQGGRGR